MGDHVHDLTYAGVAVLAKAYRTRQLSPVEVVEAKIDRAERLNDGMRAFITLSATGALEQARRAEAELLRGQDRGILHGVPFAVKDQMATRLIRTTAGSTILRDWIPASDSTVVARLLAAGAVLIGKLNMSEFALGQPLQFAFGVPRNPWNLARGTGGSSGGSGAAVAAGMVTVAIGEDTGGSVRQPASYCGIVGLRPTWGLVSRFGLVPAVWELDTIGPMARSVEDAAHLLNVISGSDPMDPTTLRRPVPDYASKIAGGLKGLKGAVIRELLPGPGLDAEVEGAVYEAIATLKRLGLALGEVSIPLILSTWVIYQAFADPAAAVAHLPYLVERAEAYDRNTRVRLATGLLIPGALSRWAERVGRTELGRQILDALKDYDVLLTPTTPTVAPSINQSPTIPRQTMAEQLVAERSYREPFSIAGVPALALCCGFSTAGLPISLQIIGRPACDCVTLRVGHAYQQATEWHNHHPRLP